MEEKEQQSAFLHSELAFIGENILKVIEAILI